MRKRTNRYFTLLLVPEGGSKTLYLRLPWWGLKLAVILIIFILVATTFLGYLSFRLARQAQNLRHLEFENLKQAQEIARLRADTQALEDKINEVEALENKVRQILGVERQRSTLSSRGSHASRRDAAPQELLPELVVVSTRIAQLKDRLPEIARRLQDLDQQIAEHLAYLQARPSLWPVEGEVTSPFGYRRSPTNRWRWEFHDGLDIAAPPGTPVRAAGGGQVVYAGWMGVYGLVVIIDHGYSYRTFYGHNSSLLVKEGDRVAKGQPIARVGSTGRSTGPHLHFRIEVDGQAVDPRPFLP
ncbi:Murein DD-endopeptidase MepM and murein hydrolase activator NlpD, contain LysM domain [Thermanaeromonas toyohensis ToBE]|uniref:Murein DD-endopeptidase MepM and murein hydrolase activator NlpD, contain LysM domain n=2 Tax=Thermanaeromonas TaxID=202949 RepID=A0A1W1VHW5_9FIRM|nr:Murein DD-endopeptidase MepM and murein hydrolase activator NlpD, contain LysM domain [Thermanaeromonas toyohensis ToBE]